MSNSNPLSGMSMAIDMAMQHEKIVNDNAFPINAFPLLFKDLIIDLKKSLNYPTDYTGTAILTAIATTIGTSAKVRVKSNWFEYASIYSCLIGNAGANKTHPINTIFSPIKTIDGNNHDTFVSLHSEWSKYQNLSKKEKQETSEVFEPKLTKSILTNFTPEVLNKRLSENLRGCTVLSDEMATFFEGMNNYSKGDQIGIYLSFWSNQPTTIDRIGNPIPLFIQNPFLSIIGGLQPRMLASAFPIQKLNNGFFQRFLFAFPNSTFKEPINDYELDCLIIERYKTYINDSFSNVTIQKIDGNIESKILKWNTEAKDFFYQWQKENCEKVNEYQNNIKGEIISKFDNHFVRLSLLLQLMEDPESNEIQIRAVNGAKELCEYYMNSSFKVLSIIQDPKEYLETLTENKKKLYFALKERFTTAEAVDIAKGFELQERRIKEFLNDTLLFKRIQHGLYEKIIKN
jgi:hypothetical protein